VRKTSQLPRPSASNEITLIFCWPYLSVGGVQHYFLQLAAEAQKLESRFCRVLVVLPLRSRPLIVQQFLDRGCEVVKFKGAMDETPKKGVGVALRRRVRDLYAHVQLYRALKPLVPGSVIHSDVAPSNGSGLLWILGRKAPVFTVFNSAFPELGGVRQSFLNWKLKGLGRTRTWSALASTVSARVWLEKLLARPIELALLGVLQSEVDDAIETTINLEQKETTNPAIRIMGVGQLIHRKGVDLAIEAVGQLRDRGFNVTLSWIGSGPNLSGLEVLIENRNLGEFVSIRENFKVRMDYLCALAQHDIYIQPSRFEGLPIALLEAMALGMPVVATNIDGIPEVVEHQQTGLLIPSNDAAALTQALAEIVENPTRSKEIGQNARNRVLHDYEMKDQAAKMFERYRAARSRCDSATKPNKGQKPGYIPR
jgi:glycosyltransferase involved in cell wall biosynthesis